MLFGNDPAGKLGAWDRTLLSTEELRVPTSLPEDPTDITEAGTGTNWPALAAELSAVIK